MSAAVRLRLALCASCALLSSGLLGMTFTVTTTADSGAGSLRQAIMDANTNVGADSIHFNITGGGVQTIVLASALPKITDPVTIDGFTQPGASANTNGPGLADNSVHLIEINGFNVPISGNGLEFDAGSAGSLVRGLVINRVPDSAGIAIYNVANVTVEGCFLGTDPTGTSVPSSQAYGVLVDQAASGATIGGTTAAARNVISGSLVAGIGFGTNFGSGGDGHKVQGNFVGTNAAGTAALANAFGIDLTAAVTNTTVGGTTASARNVISGNTGRGVLISHSLGAPGFVGDVVEGNFIGTDVTGTLPLGNGDFGVENNGQGSTIGGSAAGAGNVISGNAQGGINCGGCNGMIVQGNFIGTDLAQTLELGNVGPAITLSASNVIIGGIDPGEGNVIAFNSGFPKGGIFVSSGTGNAIRGNSIHDNLNIGIDLGGNGPHPNDAGDADGGANNGQNFPLLKTVTNGANTEVTGVLHSTPSTMFQLDFYSNPACSKFPRDFIQGETYLSSSPATTDGSGDAPFDVMLPATQAGERISVTATDPSGNTSEFSQRLPWTINVPSGPPAGGTSVQITGTDFDPAAAVTFGGQPATGVSAPDSTHLNATSPALNAGTANDIVVTNPDGTTGALLKGWVADFLDVPANQQFYFYVTKLVSNGITAGIGGGNYGVDNSTLRQQMAVFLLKSKHGLCYVPPACTGVFGDVPCPSQFADWIEALAAESITGGCGGGNYCPANPVTRQQMAVFLLRAEHGSSYTPPNCTGVFGDVPCPSQYANWIETLFHENIATGCGSGNYCPLSPTTRGQMAVFITRTFSLQ